MFLLVTFLGREVVYTFLGRGFFICVVAELQTRVNQKGRSILLGITVTVFHQIGYRLNASFVLTLVGVVQQKKLPFHVVVSLMM